MAYCCVPLCVSRSKKGSGISFHEIPNNAELREKWIKAISRKDWVPNSTSNYSRVCSKHFTVDDFSQVTKIRRLNPKAVPTIFDYYQSSEENENEEKTKKKDRRTRKELDTDNLPPVMNPVPIHPGFIYDVTVIQDDAPTYTPENSPARSEDNSSMTIDVEPEIFRPDPTTINKQTDKPTLKTYSRKPKISDTSPIVCKLALSPSCRDRVDEQNSIRSQNNSYKTNQLMLQKGTQAKYKKSKLLLSTKREWAKKCRNLQNKIITLEEQAKNYYTELQVLKNDPYVANVLKLKEQSKIHDISAIFLLDQIYNYTMSSPMWTKTTLQQSAILRNISVDLYENIRSQQLLKLPSDMTLSQFKESLNNTNIT